MCWLRQTLLFLLIIPNFGLVFEEFFIANHFNNSQQNSEIHQNRISDCLTSILRNRNLPFKPVIQIYLEAQSSSERQRFLYTVDHLTASNEELARIGTLSNERVNCLLCLIDSTKSLENIWNKIEGKQKKNIHLSTKDEYYLIILPKAAQNLTQFLKQIVEFCWSKPILNMNVLVEGIDSVITIYTYYPFTKTNCRNVRPVIQNRFINGKFERNESFFLSKTSNFWKCPIIVILWEKELFLGEIQKSLHPSDYMYLETLANMLNASLRFVISPQGKGEVYENGSFDKAFKMLNDKDGDLMTGLWCARDRQLVFEGVPYSFDNELIIFKMPPFLNSLDILTFPYDCYTWLILLLLSIGKWISKLLLKHHRGPHQRNAERMFLGLWLLSIFILRIIYEGLIFKFLHNKPRSSLPNNLEEALAHNYRFIVPVQGLSLYSQIQGLKNRYIIGNETEYFETFNQLGDNYALIASEKYSAPYKIKTENYFTAKQPLMRPMDCFYLPRYSFLTREFKKLLKLLDEHGIRKKIMKTFKAKKNMLEKNNSDVEKFSLQHVVGAFQMLLILVVVSGLIFCMELVSRNNRYVSIIMDWFH